jgi:hypothetical protein
MRRRKLLVVLAGLGVVCGALGVYVYRPWEAHYRGRPTSWWAWEVCRWVVYERTDGKRGITNPSPITPSDLLRDWLSGAPQRDTVFFGSPLMQGDPAAVSVLVELSRHLEKTARWFAVTALGKTGRVSEPAARGYRRPGGPRPGRATCGSAGTPAA